MKVPTFQSVLAPAIRDMITLRQSLGYSDCSVIGQLALFDRYLMARGDTSQILTRELVEGWASSGGPLKPRSRARRLYIMRLLGRFIAQTHPDTYIPGPAWGPRQASGFRPHIYSMEELHALLAQAALLTPTGSLRPRMYVTLLCLLYSTGLRISEALALQLADIDLADGTLLVRESKFHKSRLLPVPDDVTEALKRYQTLRATFGNSQDPDAPLFTNQRKRVCNYQVVFNTFLAMARKIGLRGTPGTKGPRLHDLRHTCAVHRLLAWYRDGGNVQARLPLLSDYLEHVSIVSTQVYLEITAELLGEAARRFRPPTLPPTPQKGGA